MGAPTYFDAIGKWTEVILDQGKGVDGCQIHTQATIIRIILLIWWLDRCKLLYPSQDVALLARYMICCHSPLGAAPVRERVTLTGVVGIRGNWTLFFCSGNRA